MNALMNAVPFESKLNGKDISTTIEGYNVIIELSFHAIKQRKNRSIYESAITYMVEKAFPYMFGLEEDESFIIIDRSLGLSLVGAVQNDMGEIIVSVISVIDSVEPRNPYETYIIEI